MTDGGTNPIDEVLIVDDDRVTCALLRHIVQEAKCTPLIVKTAEEAQGLLSRRPLMAFVDVSLPGATGDAFCERVRMHETAWDLPIVMITSNDRSEVIRRCFVAGADDFIPKGVLKHQILSKIEAVRQGPPRTVMPLSAYSKSLLLVTSRPYFGTVARRLLENSGYRVWFASSTKDAQRLLDEAPRNLAIAVVDADLEGAATLIEGLRASPLYKAIPIAAVGSNTGIARLDPKAVDVPMYAVDDELERFVKSVAGLLTGVRGREDRRQPHTAFYSSVEFRAHGSTEWLAGFSYDLSTTGIYVRTLTPLRSKEKIEISFRLKHDSAPLSSTGMVGWMNKYGARTVHTYPYGMGVGFVDFPVQQWAQIQEHIDGCLRGK